MGDRTADERFMAKAIAMARRGTGATYPNPCVGAVVVSHGAVVGAGHSRKTGQAHAEVVALGRAGTRARGATLYVTLEPCCHLGLTPPCTDAIVQAGIRRVVVGVRDPSDHVGGKGIRKLGNVGIRVSEGVLQPACEQVHEHYLHHVRTGRPYVTLKVAASVDGRIACANGASKWLTGRAARRHAHRLRAEHHAVAVGIDTVVADDPELTVRLASGIDPIAVVFDAKLRLATFRVRPKLVRAGTIVLHGADAGVRARTRLHDAGLRLVQVGIDRRGRLSIPAALRALAKLPIRSLLVEGGGALLGSFVAHRAWQRLFLYQAPRFLGEGTSMLTGVGWTSVQQAPELRVITRRMLGNDQLIVAELLEDPAHPE